MSRLESYDAKKLTKQSLLNIAGGVGVMAFFFIVLLPIYSKILSLTSLKPITPIATPAVAVNIPSLIQPFEATNSANVKLTGFSSASSTVLLAQNGSIDRKTSASEKGEFEFSDIELEKGENVFVAYSEDDIGNRSDGSKQAVIFYNTEGPKLEVGAPQEGLVVTQRKQRLLTVSGTTDVGTKIYLNDQFIFVGSTGSFTGQFNLNEGENIISIRAVDKAGNETIVERRVTYQL